MQSIWLPVLEVGPINDRHEHWVVFDENDRPRLRSDPKTLQGVLNGEGVSSLFTTGPRDRSRVTFDDSFFDGLSEHLVSIAAEAGAADVRRGFSAVDFSPAREAAYLARTLFDRELLPISDE